MNRTSRGIRIALVAGILGVAVAALGAGTAAADVPANTALPTITGAMTQSATLTASTGTWSGTPTSYAYQWQQCDDSGLSCVDLAGATAQTHVVTSDDVNGTLAVRVTATNSSGSTSAISQTTAVIVSDQGAAPQNTALPLVGGSATVGSKLTTTSGSWSGLPVPTSFTYAWQRCDTTGNNCNPIDGQTSTTYVVSSADLGSTIVSEVTATNSTSIGVADSTQTAVVAAAGAGTGTSTGNGPVASTPPSLTGTAKVGSTLTLATGVWSGSGTVAYAYAWQRCDDAGAGCAAIAGATDKTYTVKAADNGFTLEAKVTATDANGTSSASTAATGVIGGTTVVGSGAAGAPTLVVLPVVTGITQLGAVLTTDEGGWSSADGLTLKDAWQRCNAKGNACLTIAGAHALTYTLTSADVGHTVRSLIVGSNTSGSNLATSAATAAIGAARAIRLPGGGYSVAVASIESPDRLTIKSTTVAPTHLASRAAFTVRVRVADRHGALIRGALVHVGAARAILVAKGSVRTAATGWATIRLRPTAAFSLAHRSLTFVVTARGAGAAGSKIAAAKRIHVKVG